MALKILLVNPAIYDFAAYDFWLKPYGMLSIAGYLRNKAEFQMFDYLDREDDFYKTHKTRSDKYNKGRFFSQPTANPEPLKNITRKFSRYGLPRGLFVEYLKNNDSTEFVMIQTTMTYWYLGVKEAIDDLREYWPATKIILGGNYATLCYEHALKTGADLIVKGVDLRPLWDYLKIVPDLDQPGLWEIYKNLKVGVLKLTDGCPFKCSYCSVPKVYNGFKQRSMKRSISELEMLVKLQVSDIAFYDDSLLYKFDEISGPFLDEIIKRQIKVNLHSPNALNARFITADVADRMVRAGFKTFYLGFESKSVKWQKQTGGKVFSYELAQAVEHLKNAGVDAKNITAYQIVGHPKSDLQELEDSIRYVNSLGIKTMLADFSPIPTTPDSQLCSKLVNMDEPLMHNKTAFPIISLGFEKVDELKQLAKGLNRNIK
ncbi:MAG: radical SAM protein [Planctomycetes bacterium]|nr:radical SAM protein [Planctomycetota bacterium]